MIDEKAAYFVIAFAAAALGHRQKLKRPPRYRLEVGVTCSCGWSSSDQVDDAPGNQFSQHRVDVFAENRVEVGKITESEAHVLRSLVRDFRGTYDELLTAVKAVSC